MDRRSGNMQARPVLWTTATVRKRRSRGESVLGYMRRYLWRMVIVLTLVTPLLVVMTYQWAPRRVQGDPDDLVTVAVAAAATSDLPTVRRQTAAPWGADADSAVPETYRTARLSTASIAPGAGHPDVWYRVAAERHGVSAHLLEALHQVETSGAPDGCWPNVDGSGAVGPFQFKRAIFDRHGIDGNGDGAVDVCGFADSLHSAAGYLASLGADDDLESQAVHHALERYGTDADRVVDLARYFRWRDGALTAVTSEGH